MLLSVLPMPTRLPVCQPAATEITADTIRHIATWARCHNTTFAALVCEWAPRGGLRALARHIAAGR